MADVGPARNSDPDPSHDAGKKTDVQSGRAYSFGVLCNMLDGCYPSLVLDMEGKPILTRKTIRRLMVALGKTDTGATSGRRRVSDLMCQSFKGERWTPEVHFDLLEPVKGPDAKQLKFDDAGIVRLTAKGQWWKDHPQARDWRWPPPPPDGVEIDFIFPEDL